MGWYAVKQQTNLPTIHNNFSYHAASHIENVRMEELSFMNKDVGLSLVIEKALLMGISRENRNWLVISKLSEKSWYRSKDSDQNEFVLWEVKLNFLLK